MSIKSLSTSLIGILIGSTLAMSGQFGIQLSGSNLGIIYYEKNMAWATGASVGYSYQDPNLKTYVEGFYRYNVKIDTDTYLGLGLAAGIPMGKTATGETINSGVSAFPYLLVDHGLTDRVRLYAATALVSYESITANDVETTTISGTKGVAGVTLLF